MTSNNCTMPKKDTELVLRDLQTLLRETIGNEVIVVKYDTINLLPKGENYSSTMLKVNSVIKRTEDSPEENLALVAKMIPVTEFQQSHINCTTSFNKEMYVYKILMPAFRELEKEVGVKDEDLIDITPKYYGGRLSMNREKLDVADIDAVMLMENLKEHGYYTMNRIRGLDLGHAKMALRELARFHALSMALRKKKPSFFEEVKKSLNDFPFKMVENEFDDSIRHIISTVCEYPQTAKYEDRIRASIEANKDWIKTMNTEPEEPWIAINHGDFWSNNMLFRQENGKVKDIKFVDFQITRVSSPLKDLPYFLCGSVAMDVMEKQFDELLDTYHNSLIDVLTKTGCATSPYSRKSFDERLKKEANSELLRCLFAAKFFTQETSDDIDLNDMVNSVTMSKTTNLYLERSWMIVSKFVEKGWI
ncbi:uncharacterized protein LOC131671812 [Phymastichus coffea]|uniref:uncharacterized protein LOC131671812 n=1 Tax=Phymastichus coffea TaxID=108790 RepID=UPI00273ACAA9|nr:uncharacterized protein LOC131671812 [Phymastichus coffea]